MHSLCSEPSRSILSFSYQSDQSGWRWFLQVHFIVIVKVFTYLCLRLPMDQTFPLSSDWKHCLVMSECAVFRIFQLSEIGSNDGVLKNSFWNSSGSKEWCFRLVIFSCRGFIWWYLMVIFTFQVPFCNCSSLNCHFSTFCWLILASSTFNQLV